MKRSALLIIILFNILFCLWQSAVSMANNANVAGPWRMLSRFLPCYCVHEKQYECDGSSNELMYEYCHDGVFPPLWGDVDSIMMDQDADGNIYGKYINNNEPATSLDVTGKVTGNQITFKSVYHDHVNKIEFGWIKDGYILWEANYTGIISNNTIDGMMNGTAVEEYQVTKTPSDCFMAYVSMSANIGDDDFKIRIYDVNKPTIELDAARMVSPSILAMDATVGFPSDDPQAGPRYVELTATINGQSLKEQIDVTKLLGPGEITSIHWADKETLKIDLSNAHDEGGNQVEVPKFERNEEFDLKAVAWSPVSGRSEMVKREVKILLPVVIIHGVTKNLLEDTLYFVPYTTLQTFLKGHGYDSDPTWYKTMWGPPTIRFSSQNDTAEELAVKLKQWVDEALKATYAAKVNLIGHSLGGLIGRYYITEHDRARVHKLITIGTPHKGSTLFHKIVFAMSKVNARKKLETSDHQPNLRRWLSPYYSCLYDYDTEEAIRNPFPGLLSNLFHAKSHDNPKGYDKPPPEGVIYYSIYNTKLKTPEELYLDTQPTWHKFVRVKANGLGDGTVLKENAISSFARNIPISSSTGHGGLPGDYQVQWAVLDALKGAL